MYQFEKAIERWWQKPLVVTSTHPMPAELVILNLEMKEDEDGGWLNSRGTKTIAKSTTVKPKDNGDFSLKVNREAIPQFVQETLNALYEVTNLGKGVPDLILWNTTTKKIRFIEVKCPHWDKPSKEQDLFIEEINKNGMSALIVEWEFV